MAGILNKIHSTPSDESRPEVNTLHSCLTLTVPEIVKTTRPILQSCQDNTTALASLIPANQFWRWKDNWSVSLRNAIFSAAMVEYLSSGNLVTLAHVSEVLGSKRQPVFTASIGINRLSQG